MKRRAKFVRLFCLISLGGILGGALLRGVNDAGALDYQSNVGVGFTFNPTISVSLSDSDLTIDGLIPGGGAADSNVITVDVSTNTAYGYTLTSTVGASNTTRNLVNSVDNTKTFASIDFGSGLASLTTDNTWGYSYSSDNGTTWANYSGLPLYGDSTHVTTLIDTDDAADSGSIKFKIAAKAGETQASGAYTNVVNFYAVTKLEPHYLYDEVQKLSKGTLTANNVNLSDAITQANSGVYEYSAGTYGASSDTSDAYTIYFYRGILDKTTTSYGSDGLSDAYPNYVKLKNNTCWRIVRTTGSGGVKMIYNGTYKNNTCANNTGNAQISTAPFNTGSWSNYTGLQYQNMHAVGYTYSNVPASTTTATSLSTLLGATGDDTTTNENSSIIKQYIETWYAANMTGTNNYTSRLEKSAGYCNDRTVYYDGLYGVNNKLAESTTVIPYGTRGMAFYRFGAYARNLSTSQNITLGCPRGKVDLYSTTTDTGNGQLTYPITLLTADEAAFAGSGRSEGGTTYSANSYLRSGDAFWLLSPLTRDSDGVTGGFFLNSNGYLVSNYVGGSYGVRPAISLISGTQVVAGTGIATDPWTIED